MSDPELVKFIGETVISNWKYILSSIIALIGGAVALSWFVSNLIHKKEIRLLQLELSHQKDRFSQFETIMEKRILMLQNEAELLSKSLTHENPAKILNQSNSNTDEVAYMDVPAFLRKGDESEQQVAENQSEYKVKENNLVSLIERTDLIKAIIKGATAAF